MKLYLQYAIIQFLINTILTLLFYLYKTQLFNNYGTMQLRLAEVWFCFVQG